MTKFMVSFRKKLLLYGFDSLDELNIITTKKLLLFSLRSSEDEKQTNHICSLRML